MSQSELFQNPVRVALDNVAAIQAKQHGQALVESHNEDFVEVMREEARRVCYAHGTVTSDDLREYAGRAGLAPNSPNAWGCLFLGKEWESVGFERSRLVSNHARTIRRWRFNPFYKP